MSRRAEQRLAAAAALAVLSVLPAAASAQTAGAPLVLEAKIPLGQVNGRIDHLGVDLNRRRLFVAELGNNTLGVVDLAAGRTTHTIGGFNEPQGVAYAPFADSVYVANGGDGSVRVLRGEDLAPVGRIELGSDADNVRVDFPRQRVLVGYGKGALAIIDPASRAKTADIRLKAHPEGFQIDEIEARVFVNIPDAQAIAVADLTAAGAKASWPTQGLRSNFPMAIDGDAHRVLVVFRSPPALVAFAAEDGRAAAKLETCRDADDVFVDAKRRRVYVSCGEGIVDVLEQDAAGYRRLAVVPTVSGARTSLFVPELDRLYLAVRASSGELPAIWVFRPTP
jgi:DNA-binding beta-propeller fold protein YncE